MTAYFAGKGANPALPLQSWQIVNFLAYLFEKNYASSTILSHASAISYIHQYLGFPSNTDSFLVKKFLKGTVNLASTVDSRLPITLAIFKSILDAIPKAIVRRTDQVLLRALFSMLFCMFLRMGEVCVTRGNNASRVIQRRDVTLIGQNKSVDTISVCIRHFKHKKDSSPVTLHLENKTMDGFNPVKCVQEYFKLFKHASGPLFQFIDETPVSYNYAAEKLRVIIIFLGLDPTK